MSVDASTETDGEIGNHVSTETDVYVGRDEGIGDNSTYR